MDKEYSPISGSGDFCKLTAEFAFGAESNTIKNNLVYINFFIIIFLSYRDVI